MSRIVPSRLSNLTWLVAMVVFFASPCAGAGPDDYVGDSAIFGGATSGVAPNVLILLDTSGSMNDEIPIETTDDGLILGPYDPDITYPDTEECHSNRKSSCDVDAIYQCQNWQGNECQRWQENGNTLGELDDSCEEGISILSTEGIWSTSEYTIRRNQGDCRSNQGGRDNNGQGNGNGGGDNNGRGNGGGGNSQVNNVYATGNYVNWLLGRRGDEENIEYKTKIEIAKEVIEQLVTTTAGVNFGLMKFNSEDGGAFVTDNGYTTTVEDLSESFSADLTNRDAFLRTLNTIEADGWTPLAESLYESARYFRGEQSAFTPGLSYTSPITASCQANYVILITDGMSRHDRHSVLESIGDQDGDGFEPAEDPDKNYGSYRDSDVRGSDYLDDVAAYLFDNDHSDAYDGIQNVVTYAIGFGEVGADAGAVKLLNETISNGTGGARTQAWLAMGLPDLSDALRSILAEIKKVNTAFAAPVVPSAPQNRFSGGKRIYFGLFQPTGDGRWHGNLKKYGIDEDGRILQYDDTTEAVDDEGRFLENARSFWSSTTDGDKVAGGGTGGILLERDFSSADAYAGKRRIYSNLTDQRELSFSVNHFALENDQLTAQRLGVAEQVRDLLIDFIHGYDRYDDDRDGDTGEKRSWILGDILHAAPTVVHYDDYEFTTGNEADPTINKSVVYVAANDGQLHAFRDADGKELWSFIPDILLPSLKALRDGHHTYFVDMAPSVFIFDPDKDGPSDSGDKVILLFGLRRGGGEDALLENQVRGAYYALDVSVPEAPRMLWKLTRENSGFEEMGETWSQPSLVRMRIAEDLAVRDLVLAVFGAGYDNNEDLRFGNTQGFPAVEDSTDTTLPTNDAGYVTSSDGGSQHNPRGRGLFAVKVGAYGSNSAGSFFTPAETVEKIWSYTFADDEEMTFGIPSEVAALDINHDGYVDRFYVGDTGGYLWRVSAPGTNPGDWRVDRIFDANMDADGLYAADVGRKFFHRPSVTVERNGRATIFIGSGDQAHPLNEGVVDRLYAIKDPVPAVPQEDHTYTLNESDLMDVTANMLQEDDPDESVSDILSALYQKDGWFIRLNENDGEKVLSSPLVFNRVAYYTTFASEAPVADDPCDTGNLGVSRVYAVNYLTGEAVFNYDPANDDEETENNDRALNSAGEVLRRSDRVKTLGSGIPTGARVLIPENGEAQVVIGTDGGIQVEETLPGGGVIPLYWMQR